MLLPRFPTRIDTNGGGGQTNDHDGLEAYFTDVDQRNYFHMAVTTPELRKNLLIIHGPLYCASSALTANVGKYQ